KQKIDLGVYVHEYGFHVRLLRVRSTRAARSLLCLTGHGSAGSRLRSAAGSLASDRTALARAAFKSGSGSTSCPPSSTGRSIAWPLLHSPERARISCPSKRNSCLAPGRVALSWLSLAVK